MLSIHRRARALSTLLHIALLTACGAGGGGASRGIPADSAAFKVALLTPGPISDHSWNAGAYQGLLRIQDSLGARISHIQVKTPADFEENFRAYGAQRYDLVFGHGFEFQDAASRVGPEYPRTIYVTTSGNRLGKNVAPMVFGFEEPSYLAGLVAGTLTKTRTVGVIGGTELPPVKSSFLAFTAGVHAVDPGIKVLTSYLGTWDDASAGKEQALAQIRRGADLIFQNADAAGLGIFQAARESKGVYIFGSNSDQNTVAPEVIIASVVIDLPHAFLTVAREVKNRSFTSRVIYLGSTSEVVKLVVNPKLQHLITPALQARLDSARGAIASGTLHPPRIEFVDTVIAR
jgi:basic membrane lipoprotein Med (substrate-binding protein (PBP1-ABC) superfamily)